ncbi:hypothetical protein CVT26_014617 [Gymnopilus dilepis]|uniref:C2H2-type domain-containing protein n=1 Tax=Gymnopilus dilepis TaxID=231916 RepID=A0A409VWR1_9AGAR|nr:hypothetical protein CVT26_014617 [Gymnopilus dilepis]
MFKNILPSAHSHFGDQSHSLLDPASPTSSSSPLTNMDATAGVESLRSPPPSLVVDTGLDHITCLERTVCSNYFCCGRQHADLHALLEHFEEDHVIVLGPNGKRLYPSEKFLDAPSADTPSPTATPGSSRSSSLIPISPSTSSSSVTSSPSEPPSPTSTKFTSPPESTSCRKSSLEVPPVYTPFTPSLPVDPADPYGPEEVVDLVSQDDPMYSYPLEILPPSATAPPFGLSPPEFEPSSPSSSSGSGSDGDEEMSDGGSSSNGPINNHSTGSGPLPTYVYGTDKLKPITVFPKHVAFSATPPNSTGSPSSPRKGGRSLAGLSAEPSSKVGQATGTAKARPRNRGTSGAPSRKREKMYKCPQPRCTKSYLNPNGLKYHLEKGTCKLEDEVESAEESSIYRRGTSPPDSTVPRSDHDVDMLDAQAAGAPQVVLGSGREAHATAASLPPSDSNPSAPSSAPMTINYIDNASTAAPQYHHHPPDSVGVTSTSSSSSTVASGATTSSHPPSSSHAQPEVGSEPGGSCSPTHQDAQNAPPSQPSSSVPVVYHYPVPTYPQASFLSGAGSSLTPSYVTSPYYHKPYYPTANSIGSDGGQYPSSSTHAPPAQPPMPLAVSSSRMQ